MDQQFELNMPKKEEIKTRFRQANKSIDSGSSYLLLDDKWDDIPFYQMASKAWNQYRQDRPSLSRGNRDFTFAFATLKKKDTKGQPQRSNRNDPSCLCEKNHSYTRCFYLNPSMRKPYWFRENPTIRSEISRALQDEDTRRRVENQINRYDKSGQNKDDPSTLEVGLSALERENQSEFALPALSNGKWKPTNSLFSS